MKVLVSGGVAAGTKTAAKLKREDRSAEVTILTKGKDISYAGCGLPYYVGGVIEDKSALIVNTPESFSRLTGVAVQTGVEVVAIDRENKTVKAVRVESGEESVLGYDKLVIASGASPFVPSCKGTDLEGVYVMRTPEDAISLRGAVEEGKIRRAVVVGGGFIGLEVAENLALKGVKVSVIDFARTILPGFLDEEMASYTENVMLDNGINVATGVALEEIIGEGRVEKVKTSKRAMKADACILAMGIRPNTGYLENTGIEMFKGTVLVDEHMRTNDPAIYAVGDCAMVKNRLTGKPQWSPMGSTANIAGRGAAMNLAGHEVSYPGVLGTGVAKLPGICIGRTGLGESQAKDAGYDAVTVLTVVDDKAHYYPGASSFIIKLIADKPSRKILGAQVLGKGAVDKVMDIAVTGISLGMTVDQLSAMDFSYAPPFSTAIHPMAQTANVLLNKMDGALDSFTPAEYAAGAAEGYTILDAAPASTIPGARHIDLTAVEGPLPDYPQDAKLLLVCTKGKRAYLLQNRLKFYGYTNTKVLEGGTFFTSFEEDEE